jgi:hypothetical protein
MVKAKSSLFPSLLALLFILIFALQACADQPLSPSFLTAISDQDGKVPLFWFKPNPDTFEISYDGDSMYMGKYVSPEWHHNCLAVKITSPEVPFYLLKSKVFVSYDGADLDSNYNFHAPFFITVNEDSEGIPQNAYLDSVVAWATGDDTGGHKGEWVEVEHDLLIIDASIFWIVFHWQKESPLSPLVGVDCVSNVGNSFWGMKKAPHFEWHWNDYNIMIRAVIVANGDDSCEVDSFKIYRSDTSFFISDDNLIGSLPSNQFQYVDSNVNNEQTYFYKVTSFSSGGESEGSSQTSATPKQGAVLIIDQNSFEVNLNSPDSLVENLTLTNSGGLPLEFDIEIDMEKQSWMGGSDKFGYTWTDKNHQEEVDYSWVDIEESGMPIGANGDDNKDYGFFELNFSFPFYGNLFDSLRIASDGWISFNPFPPCYTDTFSCYINRKLPYIWGPYNLIAPFWDDLIFSDSSRVYFYSNDFDSAIISFINLYHYGSGGPYTFQTILNRNGEIVFQYDSLGEKLNSATVGIQNWNGTKALQIACNQDYLEDSLWVKIRPSWIFVDSMSGTISPGANQTLNLTFQRLSYPQGIYHADLILNSRDKNHDLDTIRIPLTLCIDTTTSVDFDENQKQVTFTLFQNYPNPFNPSTVVRYTVGGLKRTAADGGRPTADNSFTPTTLKIYNILGQKVRTLVDEPKRSGSYEVIWDGKDDKGKDVASGIYFYRLTADSYQETKKMVLMK